MAYVFYCIKVWRSVGEWRFEWWWKIVILVWNFLRLITCCFCVDCGVGCSFGMFSDIKKLQKYLVGSQKVPNFAPANETEVLPRKRDERSNAGHGAKVQKKSHKNFGNSKIGCNFAKPFGKELPKRRRVRHSWREHWKNYNRQVVVQELRARRGSGCGRKKFLSIL